MQHKHCLIAMQFTRLWLTECCTDAFQCPGHPHQKKGWWLEAVLLGMWNPHDKEGGLKMTWRVHHHTILKSWVPGSKQCLPMCSIHTPWEWNSPVCRKTWQRQRPNDTQVCGEFDNFNSHCVCCHGRSVYSDTGAALRRLFIIYIRLAFAAEPPEIHSANSGFRKMPRGLFTCLHFHL